jgi:translation initiation factor IF-3
MAVAERLDLDLVLINDKSDPAVVKVVNAEKLRYQAGLKKKHDVRNTNTKDVKEVKLTFNIGQHDYQVPE